MEINKWTNKRTNKWDDDTNSDYDDEDYTQNEVPPPAIDQDFINNILDVKHKLYDTIVLSPDIETPEAQNNKVLQDYLNNLKSVYILALNAQRGNMIGNDKKINSFPPEARDAITHTLKWISDFFSKNTIPDTIPYSDFIRKSFIEYQFNQDTNLLG